MVRKYIPSAGDIVWVDFSPTHEHEQSGRRPAIIVSERAYIAASRFCIVCPITSRAKGYSNEVPIKAKDIVGVVLIDQLKTLDIDARSLKKIARTDMETLENIRQRIGLILGMDG